MRQDHLLKRYPKNRKPIIALVCEGRNKSERLYFKHFNNRSSSFILKIFDAEVTDILNMGKKSKQIYKDLQMDSKLGDRMFCLVDLDLDKNKYENY